MGYTNSSNDQLVGCLTDHLQNDDLENLINNNNLTNSNQHQYNQIQYIVNSNQLINQNQLNSNQLRTNQFEINRSTNFNQTQFNLENNDNNFNFNNTDFNKDFQLNPFNIDDELEFNHLKELEDLMDITQINQQLNDNQINSQIDNSQIDNNQIGNSQLNNQINNQLNNQINNQLSNNQINNNQINQLINNQQLINQQLVNNQQLINQQQLNQQQLNQQQINNNQLNNQINNQQFLTTNSTHPTNFDNTIFNTNNSTSAQCNQRCNTVNIQTNNSTNDNFLNSTQLTTGLNNTCSNFLNTTTNKTTTNLSSILANQSNDLNSTYCDNQLINSNLNNLSATLNQQQSNLNTSPINQPQSNLNQINSQANRQLNFNPQSPELFCQQLPTTSAASMIKSDSTLLSNWNQNQFNKLNNQMINSNYSNSNFQSNPSSSSNLNQQQTQLNAQFKQPSKSQNNLSSVKSPSNEWLDNVTQQVYKDMKSVGICVIDNFLGSILGEEILNEVVNMYGDGYFKDGLLVGNKNSGDKNIRGDKIHWVEGKEPNCINIGYLMRTLDQIIMRFSRMNAIDGCTILNRTKAMIACYPGEGTKYVKHVDNCNQDGRYITCIYYLNKKWNSKINGGTLRIFPKNLAYVANIEPIFDRVIFFWSDRRNPHEVMPSYAIRFAITLWYFNQEERSNYIKQVQTLQSS